ncbi:MAG: hypothetical protein JSS40_02665 [Proteobacteria bacterium]|nr:hypothetical protein [Pseudomonadota bacterium]
MKDLYEADLRDIGFSGVAIHQAVSMVNYILRLSAPKSKSDVAQLTLIEKQATRPIDPGTPSFHANGGFYSFRIENIAQGLGAIKPGEKIVVAGHSLGGHLAGLAARLFPGLISDAYTYNAPGFDPSTAQSLGLASFLSGTVPGVVVGSYVLSQAERLTEQFVRLFADSGALPQAPASSFSSISSSIHAVTSEDIAPGEDNNVVSSTLITGKQPAVRQDLAVERNSHDMGQIVDSLRVHALLEGLNPEITFAGVAALYRAISPNVGDTEEKLAESLYRTFLGTSISIGVADAAEPLLSQWISSGDFAKRGEWHSAMNALEDAVAGQQEASIVSLLPQDIEALVSNAGVDFGYFRALSYLTPYAVIHADAMYESTESDLFSRWCDEFLLGEVSEGSEFSDRYLRDRAQMLVWKNIDYTADGSGAIAGSVPETYRYTDKTLKSPSGGDLVFVLRGRREPGVAIPAYVTFGSDQSETLTGGDVAVGDHLYGGGGNDVLDGQGGTDYLEGNAGDDTLQGGAGDDDLVGGFGFDTYIYDEGDDFDFVTDFDGRGQIVYNGRVLNGGTKIGDGVYEDAAGVEFMLLDDGAGVQALFVDGNMYVENFVEGMLGIRLGGEMSEPESPQSAFAHVYLDHENPLDFDPRDEDDQFAFIRNLYGSAGDDLFETTGLVDVFGRAGNDAAIYVGTSTYGNTFDMGAGDDVIDVSSSAGRAGFGRLAGGGGNDYITGSSEADTIWGDNYLAISQEVFHGPTARNAGAYQIDGFVYNATAEAGEGIYGSLLPGYGVFAAPFNASVHAFTFSEIGDRIFVPEGAAYGGDLGGALAHVIGPTATFDDYIDAGGGDDGVVGGSGSDKIYGGAGNDFLTGDYGTGISGAPSYFNLADHFGSLASLFGRAGDDYVDGGDGNDFLFDTDGGNDILIGGAGDDTIQSAENFWKPDDSPGAHNTIHGGAGNDTITADNNTGGFDVVDAGDGDDLIDVRSSRYSLDEDEDGVPDVLGASNGRAIVFGGTGNDVLRVTADDGLVDGGVGDDDYTLSGQSITVSDPGGEDTLHLFLPDLTGLGAAMEAFPVMDPEDEAELDASDQQTSTVVSRDGSDLVFTDRLEVEGTQVSYSQLRFSGWFANAANRIERIATGGPDEPVLTADQFETWGGLQFGGGGADDLVHSSDYSDYAFGQAGDDLISTGAGADRISGGRGDDELYGGPGDDIYYYGLGDGHDVVYEASGFDEIRFGPDIATSDVAVTMDESGIAVTVGTGRIDVAGGTRADTCVEQLRFADGALVSLAALLGPEPAPPADADQGAPGDGGAGDSGSSAGDPGGGPVPGEGMSPASASEASPPAVISATGSVESAAFLPDGSFPTGSGVPVTSPATQSPPIAPEFQASADAHASVGAPLDLETLLDAVQAFDAGSAGLAPGSSGAFAQRGPDDQASAPSPGPALSSWALTNALLEFHLGRADSSGAADGVGDLFGESAPPAGIGLGQGPLLFGSPAFGRAAQGLPTFSGLQEGFLRLA